MFIVFSRLVLPSAANWACVVWTVSTAETEPAIEWLIRGFRASGLHHDRLPQTSDSSDFSDELALFLFGLGGGRISVRQVFGLKFV